jgi:hypothetical protein
MRPNYSVNNLESKKVGQLRRWFVYRGHSGYVIFKRLEGKLGTNEEGQEEAVMTDIPGIFLYSAITKSSS